MLSFILKYWFW